MRGAQVMLFTTAVCLLAAPAAAQPVDRNPFQGEFVSAEAAGGMLLGFGMGWGMAILGAEVLGPHGGEDPGLMGGLTGFALGLVAGSSLGVHLVARGYGFPASYVDALGGALAGVLFLPAVPVNVSGPVALIGIFALPAVTSAIASSLGSASRVRPLAGADGEGARLGVVVAF